MGQKSNWAIGLFSAGAAGIVAGVVGAAQIAATKPDVWSALWFVSILSVAAVLFVIAVILTVGAFQERPRLVFGEPVVHLRGVNAAVEGGNAPLRLDEIPLGPAEPRLMIGTFQTTHVGPSLDTAFFAYVPVENRPARGGQDAANVKARIRFLDAGGALITEMHGRWADTDMDHGRDKILRAPEVPLPANGNARLLDVALKYFEDDQCFAMNDENVMYRLLRHRPLGNRPVHVQIDVRGSGCHASADFDLIHAGSGSVQQLIRRMA